MYISLDFFWSALASCLSSVFGWLDSHGVSITIAGHTWQVTFLKAALTFAFLCFFFMLVFPHFYYEEDDD